MLSPPGSYNNNTDIMLRYLFRPSVFLYGCLYGGGGGGGVEGMGISIYRNNITEYKHYYDISLRIYDCWLGDGFRYGYMHIKKVEVVSLSLAKKSC